jgi:hypothetical protein
MRRRRAAMAATRRHALRSRSRIRADYPANLPTQGSANGRIQLSPFAP